MTFALEALDYMILRVLWMFHIIYDTIMSIGRKQEEGQSEEKNSPASVQNIKKHFIHLYTTTSPINGRPVCYMDVYEILSPSDEQRLRKASSKGIPNKTYYKYHQNEIAKDNDLSQTWLGYSTLAF